VLIFVLTLRALLALAPCQDLPRQATHPTDSASSLKEAVCSFS